MPSAAESQTATAPIRRLPGSASAAPRQMVVCVSNGQFHSQVDPSDIDELIRRKDTFLWLDLQNPQAQDIELLREEFKFHRLAIEDATRHHERPKLETFDNYYFMVFYALRYDKRLLGQAIGLFIGANYIVSVHEGAITTIDETIRRWQANVAEFGQDSGALLYALLDAIVDDYFPVIDQLAERVEGIEEQIFERFSEDALQEVFSLKRDLLGVRRVVAPERDVLNVLIRREVPIFERNTILYLQDVYDHIVRITDSIDTYRDLLSSALDAFLSIQSNRLNQIVKVLTVASIILMTNALVAGIYGMNFEFMPELHWPYGYPFALGLMVLLSAGLVAFFRWRKWL
ncbi:MAG TPA: magnesium/cobalt transporter CorA [Roseiflexaceae bacterium]|nr:magnesium/cobalt transporter CorA [Roseiflexaceae bacterium]